MVDASGMREAGKHLGLTRPLFLSQPHVLLLPFQRPALGARGNKEASQQAEGSLACFALLSSFLQVLLPFLFSHSPFDL